MHIQLLPCFPNQETQRSNGDVFLLSYAITHLQLPTALDLGPALPNALLGIHRSEIYALRCTSKNCKLCPKPVIVLLLVSTLTE